LRLPAEDHGPRPKMICRAEQICNTINHYR
jgi:hypothetical protein